jgi:hypothetical protein
MTVCLAVLELSHMLNIREDTRADRAIVTSDEGNRVSLNRN